MAVCSNMSLRSAAPLIGALVAAFALAGLAFAFGQSSPVIAFIAGFAAAVAAKREGCAVTLIERYP